MIRRSASVKYLGGKRTVEYTALQIEGRTELRRRNPRRADEDRASKICHECALAGALILAFVASRRVVRIRDPLAVSGRTGHDAPEVDVAVVVRQAYKTTPTAADAVALIEVADATYGSEYGDRTTGRFFFQPRLLDDEGLLGAKRLP